MYRISVGIIISKTKVTLLRSNLWPASKQAHGISERENHRFASIFSVSC